MNQIKNLLYRVGQNPTAMRAIHTFWEGFSVVFLAGLPLIVHLLHVKGFGAAEQALVSLLIASVMAAVAATRKQAASLFLSFLSGLKG